MVLANHAAGAADFLVLTQARDDLFVVRSQDRDSGLYGEIRAADHGSDAICRAVATSTPIPRDGALLGWVTGQRVTALLRVSHGQQGPPGALPSAPEVLVLPMAGTAILPSWPSVTASPFGDGRLWQHVERGQLVDIAPLVARNAGHVFWAPRQGAAGGRHKRGFVVVTSDLLTAVCRLPAGVYMDHWMLREGISAPCPDCLLAGRGVVDLAALRAS